MIVIVDEDPSDKKQQQQLLPTTPGQSSFFGPGIRPQQPTSSSPPSYSYEAAPIAYHIDAASPRHTPAPAPPSPSYPTYSADHHQHHHHHHHHQEPHPAAGVAVAVVYRRSAANRFFQALAVALIIYLALLSLSAHSLVRMASRAYHHADQGAPRATDGRIITSIDSTNWTSYHSQPRWASTFAHSAETSFVLPVTADELYLFSRGSYQGGNVRVAQSTTVGRDVRVDVRVAYHNPRALARATVCSLHKGENAHGIGIYTPGPASWTDPRDQLQFDVVWTLPAMASQHTPLHVRAFTTDTGNFAYDIRDLWQGVAFDDLRLSTSNARVRVESITLTRGSVTSSNGAIVGHFNTSDVLKLYTSNAPIQATASLLSAGGRQDEGPVRLEMRTSNGQITSSVSLMTPSSGSGSGTEWTGDFVVQARSSNGAIQLQYDDMPLGARLASDVRTSNAAAWVGMHPAFEGRYAVSTSNSRGVMKEDTRVVDPSGMGRRRVVTQKGTRNGSGVTGEVYWDGDAGGGRRRAREENVSTVGSSNARAELEL